MLINEICTRTGLTKKAIEYYISQGLISPAALENGYRDFTDYDAEQLSRISVLRKLDLSMSEIKAILSDDVGDALKEACARGRFKIINSKRNYRLLNMLAAGADYSEVSAELRADECGASILQKLTAAFPGAYGQFLSLHFAGFLNEPITTNEQRAAYAEVIDFLDNAPELPADVRDWLDNSIGTLDNTAIEVLATSIQKTLDSPQKFIDDNTEVLNQYLTFLQSDEYKNSPEYKMKIVMREFCRTSGYWEVFIPALRRLSPAYARYQQKLSLANDAFLAQYPQASEL